ncbi:glutathione S-transferase family protein [Pseudomonas sp. TWR1-1-4]|uniref:glutathione S-transferase family protein n=1 Tax=Pseudomonas sp. TWR1-1-4 TaxID=2804604 RepID=UPI003CF31D21
MYTVFFSPTANGYKILLMLEALAVNYDICHINLARDEQHLPAYLQLNPHAKIPMLLDHDTQQVVVESAAVLLYLADKHARFRGTSHEQRWQVVQWLIWQVSSLGPMAGQNYHFHHQASQTEAYSANRYLNQTRTLFQVFEQAIAGRAFICGEFSIADMAIYPWLRLHKVLHISLEALPHTVQYLQHMAQRDDVRRAYDAGAPYHERTHGDVDKLTAIADRRATG